MAYLQTKHVAIRGMAACVPSNISENKDLSVFDAGGAESFIKSTGIERRRIADKKTCSSDLCIEAAEELLKKLNWNKDSIDCVVFVSQSPDYVLPATSCLIQDRLGLPTSCYTLDISLGCSGWVYAMSVISSLLSPGTMKRGLLLAGDTISKFCSEEDKSTYPLFGDAGTVTALEYTTENVQINYFCATDGSGKDVIIIPDGGYRNPVSIQSFEQKEIKEGIWTSDLNLHLEGMDVFTFGISKAPASVKQLVEYFNLDMTKIDYFTFHQANLFMNEKIRKKLKLSDESVPYSLKDFGNTSCASIPLTMVTQLKNDLEQKKLNHIACGFGVGLSWGSMYFETDKIICLDLIEYS